MTPAEINRRLALAIGYGPKDVLVGKLIDGVVFVMRDGYQSEFDFMDWDTIGPIMERYRVFPHWQATSKEWGAYRQGWTYRKDLRTCAALAVIEAHERGLL